MEALEPLFRFIFWIAVIYLAFRLSAKYLAPYLLNRFIRKTQERFFEQNPHVRTDDRPKEEGKVSIKSSRQRQGHTHDDELGDYVDFEEVKETNDQ